MNEATPANFAERTPVRMHDGAPERTLADVLCRAEFALRAGVGEESPLLDRLSMLRGRLVHEHLQLAVLGQFKRGKSTFINALLGAAILPTGVLPLTAVATFIAWRSAPRITVRFTGDTRTEEFFPQSAEEIRAILFRFVAEEANPENRLRVERVDLFYPAAILADGTVIIDTPGVGSTLVHNTEAALQVLPECDAALFVVSADPPLTEIELEYLNQLKPKAARIFFVLNKVDYLQQDDRRTVVEFLRKVLVDKGLIHDDRQIFCVSARDGLAAKQVGDERALATSGIAALEEHLVGVLASDKRRLLDEALRGKATDLLGQASAEVDLRVRALNMPIEELASKSDAFQESLRLFENERRLTRDLLAAEHRRLRQALDSRIDRLRLETMTKVADAVDASLSGSPPAAWEETARRTLSGAMEAQLDGARDVFVGAFASDATAALRIAQDRVNTLIDRVRQTASQIFDVPLGPNAEHEAFELGEDPYWVTESVGATLIPDASQLIDRFLPASLRRPRLRRRVMELAQELTVRNGENLRWAILRGLDETFRKATGHFEERLDEAIDVTRRVIGEALERRRDQSFAVKPELDRLVAAAASLASSREELKRDAPPTLSLDQA